MNIRPATSADLRAIHGLVGELAEYEKELPAFTATLEDYERDFEEGIFQAHVAEDESGTVVGMALYYMTYSTWKGRMLYLEDFVVQNDQRGNGIGQKLFDAFLQVARERECRLVKWAVLDWNEPALRFYRRQKAVIETNWWSGKIHFEAV